MSSDTPHHPDKQDKRGELVGLLTRNQRKIFAYIYTLVPNRADAEDILQETSVTIYKKFAEFELGTDFVAWANRIAWWKVKAAQQKIRAFEGGVQRAGDGSRGGDGGKHASGDG